MKVNVHHAKTHLSELIERAEAGEDVIIARAGKPAVRLVPVSAEEAGRRVPGSHVGQFWIAEDFDAPLPEDFLIRGEDA